MEASDSPEMAEAITQMEAALRSAFDDDLNFNPWSVASFCGLARQALRTLESARG